MIRPDTDSRGLRLTSPTITIFDLEYTAWECSMARHWLTPGEFKEVVQIGAVKLDADSFAILDEFESLVVPRINPVLSPYFEKLTGITSRQVSRNGKDFAARSGSVEAWLAQYADKLADDVKYQQTIRDRKAKLEFLDYDWALNEKR